MSLVGHPFLDGEYVERGRREIESTWLSDSDPLVYEAEGSVAGFLALVGTDLGGLFVDPSHHRRGIGRALMNAAHARHSILEVSVFDANAGAQAFYESCGFTEVERRIHVDSGLPEIRLRLG